MNNLETIISTIKDKKNLVEEGQKALKAEGASALPVSAKRAKQGHINRAKLDLEELYREYRKELQNSSLFILLSGSQQNIDKYNKIAESEFGCFPTNAELLYNEIMEKVPERLYKNQHASPSFFDHFSARFEDRALEIDIIGYPPLLFESKYKKPLKDRGDAIGLMKRAFNDKVGSEVIGLDAIERVTLKAVNENFTGRFCPIILHTTDPILVRELERDIKRSVTSNVFVVTLGSKNDGGVQDVSLTNVKTITKESVESSLLKVRENLV